ncbi:PREDICTED: uncharacterized protein LOC109472580 [Branchiostoma belcheri]|uniref:Uncharacterized protein LOC109472580 n=1 Tax=Branchiostoma belcheri TaxID=7741 RepID=A0A6P4Z1V6_BRABE|nr:PREDICTED: uncharacterized protein LOC109472580 [Branchiostoma belcheri]
MKLMVKVSLLLLMQLLVPRADAGSWQSCREVPVAKCGVGDSRSDGRAYRYDIDVYRYKWNKDPFEYYGYEGPFGTVSLGQAFQSCQVCSNETRPTKVGSLPQSITDIMIVENNVGKLGPDKAEILSQIPCGEECRLWFVGCNLTTIEAGAFAKLPQVSKLVIWRSNVQTLKNGTFAGMESLKYLLLLENNLTHLEGGCLDGLPSLSHIILVDNQILTMSPDTFRGLQPWWLDVSANLIANVAPGTLQTIKSVAHVHAVENKLRSIGVGMFHGLERLGVLNLKGNRISHIAAGAFHSNTKLDGLNLAENRLTFLSGGWFKSSPHHLIVHDNGIATILLEGRALPWMKRIHLTNRPRCTCVNDWLYEYKGGHLKFKKSVKSSLVLPATHSCPSSALMRNLPVPVSPSHTLPCPPPMVEILKAEHDPAYKYTVVGRVYWEKLPQVSWTFPNDSQHTHDITYDTNTTTRATLPTGNLTVRMVTDLKAEGWVKCNGPADNLLGDSGNHSLCSNYMGRSSFTLWLETTGPLAFGNTTCTASSETGSDTVVFMTSESTTLQATEPSLINTTPFSTTMSTSPVPTGINTTPLTISKTDNAYEGGICTWNIVLSSIIWLPAVAVGPGVLFCVRCIKRRLGRKAPDNGAASPHNDDEIFVCSKWPVGNLDEPVISPYAEGRFEDHHSLNETESVISPYAEGGFQDHPDLRRAGSSQSEAVPYGQAKLCAAYPGRPRAQTHPVPSRPYSAERPRQTPSTEGAVVTGYGQNGGDKSGKTCYQHPIILPKPGATLSSAYQQNAKVAKRSRKAPCYNPPATNPERGATLSSAYQQNASVAKRSHKTPCYNSPATNPDRTLSNTYGQHDTIATVCNSVESPMVCSYYPAAPRERTTGIQSAVYDKNHRSQPATSRGNSYVCPSPATGAGRSPAAAYCQNERREAINNTTEYPETNSYEPAPDAKIGQ